MKQFLIDLAITMFSFVMALAFLNGFDVVNSDVIYEAAKGSWGAAVKIAVLYTLFSIPFENAIRHIFGVGK